MARATPTFEAAGIVVIDTSTPTTAPDFARPLPYRPTPLRSARRTKVILLALG
jgi:hypothetical protein